ncbi:hypothetical protein ACFFRR_003533 [Megaselia abdita]
MALFARISSPTTPTKFQKCIGLGFLWPTTLSKSTKIDSIDSLTNEIVMRNSQKFESLKASLKATHTYGSTSFTQGLSAVAKGVLNETDTIKTPDLGLDIRTLSKPQLDNLLLATMEIKNKLDFLYLIRQCIQWRKLPSDETLIESLKYLSFIGETELIGKLDEACKQENSKVVSTYVGLAPFKSMSNWRNGQSEKAIKILMDGYESNKTEAGKRMLRTAFKVISEETLSSKSEAVLVTLMKNAVKIYDQHKDIFGLACIWRNCFVSDWFSDQKSAEGLFNKYTELQQFIAKKAPIICSSFLRQHKTDAVHRLIELFLKIEDSNSCAICLGQLFDYQYLRHDLRACAEIVRSCKELDITLTADQNEKFLALFLNQPVMKPKKPRPHKFEYKF